MSAESTSDMMLARSAAAAVSTQVSAPHRTTAPHTAAQRSAAQQCSTAVQCSAVPSLCVGHTRMLSVSVLGCGVVGWQLKKSESQRREIRAAIADNLLFKGVVRDTYWGCTLKAL